MSGTAQALVSAVQLIILGRDQHTYEWSVYADVPIGAG